MGNWVGDPIGARASWAKNVLSVGGIKHQNTVCTGDDFWDVEFPPDPCNPPVCNICPTGVECNSITGGGIGSRGPAEDGRIKPDLAHFNNLVYSVEGCPEEVPGCPAEQPPSELYGDFGGTSAATPITAGLAGLLFEMWADPDPMESDVGIFGNQLADPACDPLMENCVFMNRPHMTTAKAMLINTAVQWFFDEGYGDDLMRMHQGWGRADVGNLYGLRKTIFAIDETDILVQGEFTRYYVNVASGSSPLKVTLTWADPPASPMACRHRINDLDLKVTSPSGQVYWGNWGLCGCEAPLGPRECGCITPTNCGMWSVSGGIPNDRDTVENVFIENPAPGIWRVEVLATLVAEDGHVIYVDNDPVDCILHPLTCIIDSPHDVDYALVVSGPFADCNINGIGDAQEIYSRGVPDCNNNGFPDECDLAQATSLDENGNTIPDECEPYVQVNVDETGANITGDAANEPSIALDPTDPDRVVIGFRHFDDVSVLFREAGWAYSADSGSSWTFPGVLEDGTQRSDPVLASDLSGNFHYLSLVQTPFEIHLFKSLDGGVTWGGPVDPDMGGDKPWMAVDKTGSIGAGNIYAVWTASCGVAQFARSIDGGASFETPVPVSGTPAVMTISIGPDGEVYVAGESGCGPSNIVVSKSTNAMDPAQTPTFDPEVEVDLGGDVVGSLLIFGGPNPGGLLGQVWVGTDHSSGPTRGNVYVLASVNRLTFPEFDVDVMFSRSTDGGLTWSADPIRINDDVFDTEAWQWSGTMSVAPDGRIDVIWNGTRETGQENLSRLYYSYSTDGGLTWSKNQPISPVWDSHIGLPPDDKIGDYYHMVSDDVATHLAWSATFNGEQDVYYQRLECRAGNVDCHDIDVCTFDCCDLAACTHTRQPYGDVFGGKWCRNPAGCGPSGFVDLDDILAMLDAFNGVYPEGCDLHNFDITAGPSGQCVENGVVDLDDILAVIAAFEGTDPCCGGGSQGAAPPPSEPSGESVVLKPELREGDGAFAGQSIVVDIFAESVVDLSGYQATVSLSGGLTGTLELQDLYIDATRPDYVFSGADNVRAIDLIGGRLAGARMTGGSSSADRVYLGTYVFVASTDASGTFEIAIDDGDGTLLRNASGQALGVICNQTVVVTLP